MFDSHTHTCAFSPDASQTLDGLITAAIKAGLSGIVVTEHMDPDLDLGLMIFDLPDYISAMDSARSELEPGFELLNGIEAGYMPHLNDRFNHMTNQYPFDLVIGSAHAIDKKDIYFYRDVFDQGRDVAYGLYLDILIDMVRKGSWLDVVGHYDYVCRVSGYDQPKITYREQPERFDTLFRRMIETGKSLEINARTIRFFEGMKLSDPLPDRELLKRYRELGGELITLGSDCHKTDEVASSFNRLSEYLLDIGFTRAFTFQNRNPIAFDLPLKLTSPN